MSGPKHLWSGDWRDESVAASDELAARRPKPQPPEQPEHTEPKATPPSPKRTRPRLKRVLPVALAAVVVLIAGGAFALTNGSSKHQAPSFATQPSSTPAPTPTSSSPPPIYWLGMQLETVPPGAAAIATVRQGSPADLAGLSPGDAIVQIKNRPINGANDISDAIHGLHAGDRVAMEISHGSALFTTVVTLAAPPSTTP